MTVSQNLNARLIAALENIAKCYEIRANVIRRDPLEINQVIRLDAEAAQLRRKAMAWSNFE